jgi:LysR family cys regulon transcriptional activator
MQYLYEVARHQFNLSAAARALHISQPGISRQIQMLEEEMGFQVLNRQGKRILGLTRQGEVVLAAAKRVMGEFNGLKKLRDDNRGKSNSRLVVATTHFHARYTLFEPILNFRREHPDASLLLSQGLPPDIVRRVASEEADIGISAQPEDVESELMTIPCLSVERVLIAPKGHPLLRRRDVSLQDICRYPLITYDEMLAGGWRIRRAFEEHQLEPDVVLTATDADVIKAYVAAGLGVAIVQRPVYDRKKDTELRALDVSKLFKPGPSVLIMRRQVYVSGLVRDFIRTALPEIDLRAVLDA